MRKYIPQIRGEVYYLADEFVNFLRTLVANRKYKVAEPLSLIIGAKKFSSFPIKEKFSGLTGLSRLGANSG